MARGCCDDEFCRRRLHEGDVMCCEYCCTCGYIRTAIEGDFDADELGLDPEEEYDA